MSARDRLKTANATNFVTLGSEANKETIVDDIINNLDKAEEKSTPKNDSIFKQLTPKVTPVTTSTELINVIDKSKVGRPKLYDGVYKPISARLKMENYEYARNVGGRFGGMNAYINYLIEQDRKRKQ